MSAYSEDYGLDEQDQTQSQTSRQSQGTNGQTSHMLQTAIEGFLGNSNSSERRLFAQMYHELSRTSQSGSGSQEEPSNQVNLQLLQSMLHPDSNFDPQHDIMMLGDDSINGGKGINEEFLDTLDRVPIKKIPIDKCCPICTTDFHSEKYPLVVELPCNQKHYFDLDCIAPWLKLNRTCPLCRVDVTVGKKKEEIVDSEVEEEDWDMYG
ncbi:hypothetical protein CANARDRAFT_30733 [[Candida] arabinofermentans NRRL YB-2248]|uniref:RING-type domain-containing protein n=1 Tax=[Candida] arabinofermentans NRRL YB-2248 TaxID=983967 RepID=A0A1E4SSW7_9ASCO|nr:hypothetical protein CANARDRAFT_30733 [[Candida] arabinofermentans NRRL YB-2248]